MKNGKKLTAVAAASAVASALVAPAAMAATTNFTDIQGNFAADAINALVAKGVLNGVDATHFAPNDNITREQFAVILAKALNLDTTGTASFGDVDSWASGYVAAVNKAGLIAGYDADHFGGKDNLTREQMATIFIRALSAQTDYKADGKGANLSFTDATSISSWAKDAVGAAVELGLIHGMTDGSFAPAGHATRAQVALVASSFLGKVDELSVAQLSSATLVDNNTITLNFSKAVDALDVSDVTVATKATNASVNVQTVTLSADKKSATVKVNTLAAGTTYVVSYNKKTAEVTTAGSLAVSNVTVLNASQLKVTFTQEVDQTSAETAGNYTLASASGAVALSGAVLQDDAKSVVLTLGTPITTSTDVSVTIKNIQSANDSTIVIPLFTSVVNVNDTTAPTVTSVTSSTNSDVASKVTIDFSEPVSSGVIKIDGVSAGSATGSEVVLSGLSLDASKSHTIQVVNLTDAASNVSQVNQTFNIVKDTAAPLVSSITANSDNQILVTFNKAMNDASVTTAGALSVKDEILSSVAVATVAPKAGDTTHTQYVITLNAPTLYDTTTSRNLTVVYADTITDSLGNAMVAGNKAVTLSQDTTAPTVTGLKFKTNPVTGYVTDVVATFSEGLTGGSLAASNITVVDGNGVLKSGFLQNATVASGATEADFPVTTVGAYSGTYSFTIAGGIAQDQALAPNDSVAYTGVLNFGAAPTGSFTFPGAANITPAGTNKFNVNFGQAVKGGAQAGSATLLSSYMLNGSALPTGTTITFTDSTQTIATITLPAGSIATTDAAAVFSIANVQNASGVTITPFTTTVAVADNTSPVLQSARILDNVDIELTYGENMATLSNAAVGTEFTITQGTTAMTLNDSDLTATIVPGYANKVKLHLNTGTFDLTKALTVKTLAPASGVDMTDATGVNGQVANTTVTVSK